MNEPVLLFVYGQLRSGGPGFRALGLRSRVRSLGRARVAGCLRDLGACPGLMTGQRGLVHGELLAFSDTRLFAALDRYEQYDPARPHRSDYLRVKGQLLGSGEQVWAYVYNRPVRNKPMIARGDWHARRRPTINPQAARTGVQARTCGAIRVSGGWPPVRHGCGTSAPTIRR